MSKVVLGLGTNIGDRMRNLQFAIDSLLLVPKLKVIAVSDVYETVPVGYDAQPDFLNAAVLLETDLSPKTVLGLCLGIEAAAGRKRTIKDGPRVLDMDVLLYENVKNDSFELTLPHPQMLKRAFVLQPLADLFPSGRALGVNFGAILRDMDKSGVRETAFKLNLEVATHGIS